MKNLFLLLMILLVVSVGYSQTTKPQKPVSVIFDTDIGPDYDDVGALAMLHALADSGKTNILATIASNQYPRIVAVLDVINTYFNRPDLPIGITKGKGVNIGVTQKWDSVIVSRYPHNLQKNEQAEDATLLYRKILSSQPDKSVTIITVGFLTNLANLLDSPPDKYSVLHGKELVRKKVKTLVCMAGIFPSGKEFNVEQDAKSSAKVFANWTTPIIFTGFEIGSKIFTGLPIVQSNVKNSPVKDVFAWSIPLSEEDKNGRMSWDETAVLIAVNGYEKYYSLVAGKIVCNSDGSNTWNPKSKGHSYVIRKMSPKLVENLINNLIMHQPVK
jgi:inosine-uridine nucleoside N-ribohydrolase